MLATTIRGRSHRGLRILMDKLRVAILTIEKMISRVHQDADHRHLERATTPSLQEPPVEVAVPLQPQPPVRIVSELGDTSGGSPLHFIGVEEGEKGDDSFAAIRQYFNLPAAGECVNDDDHEEVVREEEEEITVVTRQLFHPPAAGERENDDEHEE